MSDNKQGLGAILIEATIESVKTLTWGVFALIKLITRILPDDD